MRTRCNPPWTGRILTKYWEALKERVGEKWMPVAHYESPALIRKIDYLTHVLSSDIYDEEAKKRADIALQKAKRTMARAAERKRVAGYKEFGTGSYGTVMPTHDPGVVIKITSDASEASFVAAYLSMPKSLRPVGIVPYHRLIAIRSESHLKRPVFVIWRDEAQYVGNISRWIVEKARDFEKKYYRDSFIKVEGAILRCLDAGRNIRRLTIKRQDVLGLIKRSMDLRDSVWEKDLAYTRSRESKLAWYLNAFKQAADDMTSEPMGNYVGQGIGEAFDAGLLLADVHLGNIGMPSGPLADEIGMTPIITDPGHAIALDDRYAGVTVEEL